MNEVGTPSVLQALTDMLGQMAERAAAAEAGEAEARKSSDEWYHNWQRKDEQFIEMQAKLAAEIEEHQNTRQKLREAQAKREGDQDNG